MTKRLIKRSRSTGLTPTPITISTIQVKEKQMAVNNYAATPTTRIWGLGGAGCNIVSKFLAVQEKQGPSPLMAAFDYCLVDTSKSDIKAHSHVHSDNIYIAKGQDGSGGRRSENANSIEKEIPGLFAKWGANRVHFLVSSMDGGSGNVYSSFLAQKLLSEGKIVVVFLVWSATEGRKCENAIKSLTTFRSIPNSLNPKRPITLVPISNYDSEGVLREHEADNKIAAYITAWNMAMADGVTHLDSSDVFNVFDYQRNSLSNNQRVGAVTLELFRGDQPVLADQDHQALTALTLCESDQDPKLEKISVIKQSIGFLNPKDHESAVAEKLKGILPINFVVVTNALPALAADLKKRLADYTAIESLMKIDDDFDGDGDGGFMKF